LDPAPDLTCEIIFTRLPAVGGGHAEAARRQQYGAAAL